MEEKLQVASFMATSEIQLIPDTSSKFWLIHDVLIGLKVGPNLQTDIYVTEKGIPTPEGIKVFYLALIQGIASTLNVALSLGFVQANEEKVRLLDELKKAMDKPMPIPIPRGTSNLEDPRAYRYNTDKELVYDLEALNTHGQYNSLIGNAKAFVYHDWKSSEATPKALLCQHLADFPELEQIREKVIKGIYDEEPDEQDQKNMSDWMKKNFIKTKQN